MQTGPTLSTARRATVAVAHALLVVIYHILLWQKPYEELGAAYVDLQDRTKNAQRLVKRLNRLGYDVVVTPRAASSASVVPVPGTVTWSGPVSSTRVSARSSRRMPPRSGCGGGPSCSV